MFRARAALLIFLVALEPLACGPSQSVAELYAGLRVSQEALNGVHSAIQHGDQATKDRLADLDSRLQRLLRDIDSLLTRHEKRGEDIAYGVLASTFSQANDLLFEAEGAAQDASIDFSLQINNAILNAGRVVDAFPFTQVRPFIAMLHPITLLPKSGVDHRMELLGFFRDDWKKPTLDLDGKTIETSMGAANRLVFLLDGRSVDAAAGKRLKARLRYPVEDHWYSPTRFAERDIWITVLPTTVLSYSIIAAEAVPPVVFDYPRVVRESDTQAGVGEQRERDVVWGFEELTGDIDWVNTYDKSQSKIESAVLVDQGGNNPTGDNYNRIDEFEWSKSVTASDGSWQAKTISSVAAKGQMSQPG